VATYRLETPDPVGPLRLLWVVMSVRMSMRRLSVGVRVRCVGSAAFVAESKHGEIGNKYWREESRGQVVIVQGMG
jgi:hypothetical protein